MTPQTNDPRTVGWATFEEVTTLPATAPVSTPFRASVIDYVFGRLWTRPGLSRRDRKLVTLTCVATTGVRGALDPHVYAALSSGDLSYDDMLEFVLQFAVACGWPRGSLLDAVVLEQEADRKSVV